LEAFAQVETLTGKSMRWQYVDKARDGDHICYISNLSKMRRHYPDWNLSKSLDEIFEDLVNAWTARISNQSPAYARSLV
jgi:CDP-paratose 2-epimerase